MPAPSSAPRHINIDLRVILDIAGRGVRRASSFMALGLRVAADETVTSVKLDSNFSNVFMPDPLTPEQAKEARANFAHWIITNGLRELEQHFGLFLNEIYSVLLLVEAQSNQTAFDSISYNRMVNDTNLGGKLDRISNEFRLKTDFRDYLDSVAVARNVLGHNLGIVRARDCRGGPHFVLSWRGWDMVVGEHTVSGPFPEPLQVEEATTVTVQIVERRREFGVGQLIEISAHDLSEICMNFFQAAQQIESAAADHFRNLGVPVTVPDPKTSPVSDASTEGAAEKEDGASIASDVNFAKNP